MTFIAEVLHKWGILKLKKSKILLQKYLKMLKERDQIKRVVLVELVTCDLIETVSYRFKYIGNLSN